LRAEAQRRAIGVGIMALPLEGRSGAERGIQGQIGGVAG